MSLLSSETDGKFRHTDRLAGSVLMPSPVQFKMRVPEPQKHRPLLPEMVKKLGAEQLFEDNVASSKR
jgi:hypothetical protein